MNADDDQTTTGTHQTKDGSKKQDGSRKMMATSDESNDSQPRNMDGGGEKNDISDDHTAPVVATSTKKKRKKKKKKNARQSSTFTIRWGGSAAEGKQSVVEVGLEGESSSVCPVVEADTIRFDMSDFTGHVILRRVALDGSSNAVARGAPAIVAEPLGSAGQQQQEEESLVAANPPLSESSPAAQQQQRLALLEKGPPLNSSTSTTERAALMALAANSNNDNDDAMRLTEPANVARITGASTLFTTARAIRRLRNRRSIQRKSVFTEKHPTVEDDDIAVTTTRLHQLCAMPNVKLRELELALAAEPDAVSTRDADGCLPLHILGNNEMLVSETAQGREVATQFGLLLMQCYPEAITTLDDSGTMPFVQTILDWAYWVYETHQNQEWAEGSSSNTVRSRSAHKRSRDAVKQLDGTMESLIDYSMVAFPTVQLYNEAEWCLLMLALAMDGLGGRDGGFHKEKRRLHRHEDKRARADLAAHLVTKLPTLLKTVLLIENDGTKTRQKLLTKLSIFRRILLCPESVGPWLPTMIRHNGIAAQRGVDYLLLVSQTSVDDYVGGFTNVLARDVEHFEAQRNLVFEAIAALSGPVTSLLVLNDEEQVRL